MDAADAKGAGGGCPRELANSLLGAILAHTRATAGDDGVARVLAEAGDRRPVAEIEDPVGWSSYRQATALFYAAARVLDDPDIGRKAGAQVLRRYGGTETVAMLRALGSATEYLRLYPAISAKQSAVTRAEVVELDDGHALIAVVTPPPTRRDPMFCGYTMGAIGDALTMYGASDVEVEELECQARGHARCLMQITWDPTSSATHTLEDEVRDLRDQVAALTTRYENLEAVAMELSSARDVEAILETITRRAGMTVRAPKYLLAVRLPRDRSWRIHHVGFTDAEAAAAADAVLRAETSADGAVRSPASPSTAGRLPAGTGTAGTEATPAAAKAADAILTADVVSARAHYGRLAAFYPPGFRFMPHEKVLLAAYAGHAAAALETAAALDEARERNQTLGTLLALGSALAESAGQGEVAQQLAQALVDILGCHEAHVLLWDAGEAALTRTASAGSGLLLRELPTGVRLRDPLLAERLTVTPGPTVVSALSDPLARQVLALTGLQTAVLVPVVARGELFAVAAVAWDGAAELEEAARERLTGIAGLAATALNSAEVLDRARHQALHDPLTDLPNSRLFEERVEHAMTVTVRSGERLGVLFLDLDYFKAVNDTYGHNAGDELLRAVADRLRSSVRREDTVARVGGDEFAVLLQNIQAEANAEKVAGALVAAMGRPFTLRAATVTVGASVGVTLCPDAGDTYPLVVARADAAMYQAKASGRGRYHLAGRPAPAGSAPLDSLH